MALARLITCIVGVYATFLLWAIAQERLSSPFIAKTPPHTSTRFPSSACINACQALSSCVSALVYLLIKRRTDGTEKKGGLWTLVGWDQVFGRDEALRKNGEANGKASGKAVPSPRKSLLVLLLQVSAFQTCASPIGFASLKYISYPMMVLAKSCKLIPVLLLNVILYRRKFKPYKYAVVALVSAGIALFMYNGGKGGGKASKGGSIGLALLGVNLLIDGLTNSTQDQLFALHPGFKGQQLMFNMSLLSLFMTLPILLLPPHWLALAAQILPSSLGSMIADPVGHHATEALSPPLAQAIRFCVDHPSAVVPLAAYALLGGLGQLFIFETISHFGSLTLVMVTVTRKLVTMLLSVVVFGHKLRGGQWIGVAVVFVGIGLEAGMKRREIMNKRIMEERARSKLKAL